ncbi:NAD(P)-dependent alcohol dehydrogenase [Nonomuraea sp. NBC_01738]|uniref:NAD(P)-dependent alcohol dehydrogenase n=1 Tax=Nonomuraea sp. NBC_01738 TaxID=2976003 RepID=UPI002E10223D|nr:NAD(P)-dependent alcohol dehydrogenase [Nonomuraea sp. NBC_01738]
MKAIVQDRYGTADVLRLDEVAVPEPGDGEVVIKVHAAALDTGYVHLMTGLPYLLRLFGFGVRAPKGRLRADGAGRVEAVGSGVTGIKPGDEVFGTFEGGLAEYAVARHDKIARKPAGIGFEQAAAVTISGVTALHGVRAGRVSAGQNVLVIGAGGGVGSFMVQVAKEYGGAVTAVCGPDKADLVTRLGADRVIDYTREDVTRSGVRYDVILDIAGNRPVSRLRRILAPRGTLVLVGGEGGGRLIGGMHRSAGAALLSPFLAQRLVMLVIKEQPADLPALAELIEAGRLTPVVGRTYPLTDAADAVRHLAAGHAEGKIVILP